METPKYECEPANGYQTKTPEAVIAAGDNTKKTTPGRDKSKHVTPKLRSWSYPIAKEITGS